jgi:hypothetical protein
MGTRSRSCLQKSSYPDEDAALTAIARRVATGLAPAGLLMAYRCRFGDHYHIGHISKRIRKQAMRRTG